MNAVEMKPEGSVSISVSVTSLLTDENAYEVMSRAVDPYGDGLACGRIVAHLRKS